MTVPVPARWRDGVDIANSGFKVWGMCKVATKAKAKMEVEGWREFWFCKAAKSFPLYTIHEMISIALA